MTQDILASNNASITAHLPREAFITIGATASFPSLIRASTTTPFLGTLISLGYTHLTIQCGPDLASSAEMLAQISKVERESLNIRTFDFNKQGLSPEMRACKETPGKRKEGVVICHAGAGTILDAMRIDVPIIVVPNPDLLDNHQAELAEELERQGYVTYGDLNNLSTALMETEKKYRERTKWMPINNAATPIRRGIGKIVDEELGYEERTREMEG